MRGRKLTVDWKHTAEELYAHYKQERNIHIAKRLQALFLLRCGTPTRQVARIVGVSRMSIHKWLTWYRTGGLDELTRRTRGGNRIPVRPLLTPDQQAQRIQHAATQGFRTLREAAAWCRETLGVELSERPMRRVVEQLARVLCAVGRCVAGVVDGLLAVKMVSVAGALGGLRDGMVRLVGWDWIREALAGLPCD